MTRRFITFEGGEGAGKTTQIQILAERLRQNGTDVITTREPGGVPEAEKIRDLLVQKDGGRWDALSECMLFFTARRMHINTLIEPALQEGKTVICDRFTDSTIAYQGYGHNFDLNKIQQVQNISIGNFKPDQTFLLDLPVEMGLKRSKKRLSDQLSNEDKFEDLDIAFHERLRQGFLTLAHNERERFHIIDAQNDIDTIAADIWENIK